MQQKKLILALIAAGLMGLLGACGGGAAGNATPAISTTTGTVNMSMTDGPSDSFNHVWVTVTQISFHTDANAIWSPSDASWQTTILPAPITIDLAALNNGAMNTVFANMNLPVGSYRQVRFFFASDSDPLDSSAQATRDNEATPAPLQWNDQVEYINASGALTEAPLEIAYPVQGIQLLGAFSVTAGGTLNLVTDFDLDKIVVPYRSGTMQAFTLKPNLNYFDLSNAGGITGNVDATKLCTASSWPTSAPFTPPAGCAFNLVVHAEAVSSDGLRYEAVRSTTVKPDGTFTLAPLPIRDSSGNPVSYDIIIRGRQMQTLEVTGVTPAGTYTGSNLAGATALQASGSPLPIGIVAEYGSQLATPLAPLTSGNVVFQQTLTGGLPHEIRWSDTDPLSGKFGRQGLAPWNQNFWLANTGLNVAPYTAGGLAFSLATPTEGNGNYSVIANETAYYNFGTAVSLLTPLPATNAATFTPGAPTLQAGVQSGTVVGTIAIGGTGIYTEGEVVVARFAHIISAQSFNLTANTAPTYSITGLGAKVPGAYYYAYLRLDNCTGTIPGTTPTNTKCSHMIIPISGAIDLRTATSAAGMNVSVAL